MRKLVFLVCLFVFQVTYQDKIPNDDTETMNTPNIISLEELDEKAEIEDGIRSRTPSPVSNASVPMDEYYDEPDFDLIAAKLICLFLRIMDSNGTVVKSPYDLRSAKNVVVVKTVVAIIVFLLALPVLLSILFPFFLLYRRGRKRAIAAAGRNKVIFTVNEKKALNSEYGPEEKLPNGIIPSMQE